MTQTAWPDGVLSSGTSCGIKADGAPDLGVIVADGTVAWAGTFTKNAAAAAPVTWCRARLGAPVRALVVNSGNANACTGRDGDTAVAAIARETAASVGCHAEQVLVASTGPIGVRLPVDAVLGGIPGALDALDPSVETFARAILTTDPKVSERRGNGACVVGVGKGAAMLAPNMATMLAFVVTDVACEAAELQSALDSAVSRSFDRISVDACESTNDSVFLLSTGRAARPRDGSWEHALEGVCADLAEQMVRDAEGGTKLLRIRVEGARDDGTAAALGRAVASSVLWRSAVHGADPNWGRVVSALGSADRSLDLTSLRVSIGAAAVFENGAPAGSLDDAGNEMVDDEILLLCVVGSGTGEAEILSADISPEYVTLNATGTS
jgi:glutamate N-acetyltransferase/amino-acid N-acetyltransferase